MDRDTAQRIRDIALSCSRSLDESIVLVRSTCSEEEFRQYRLAVGTVMASIYTELLAPRFKEHPDLEPSSFKENP